MHDGRPLIDLMREWCAQASKVYNAYTRIQKDVPIRYSAGVPTAQADWSGTITFGASRAYHTLLHEMGHVVLSFGQSGEWGQLFVDGIWTGKRGTYWVEKFDGAGSRIHGDSIHFWPYQFNQAHEYYEGADIKHAIVMDAMRDDCMELQGKDVPDIPAEEISRPITTPKSGTPTATPTTPNRFLTVPRPTPTRPTPTRPTPTRPTPTRPTPTRPTPTRPTPQPRMVQQQSSPFTLNTDVQNVMQGLQSQLNGEEWVDPIQPLVMEPSDPYATTPQYVDPVQPLVMEPSDPYAATPQYVDPIQPMTVDPSDPYAATPQYVDPVQPMTVPPTSDAPITSPIEYEYVDPVQPLVIEPTTSWTQPLMPPVVAPLTIQ